VKPIQDFIAELETLDIKVWLDANPNGANQESRTGAVAPRLRCNAPKGVLTPTLKEKLSARKAEIIAYLRDVSIFSEDAEIRPQPRPEAIPLSFAQQRLWFLDRLEAGSSTDYNVPSPWQIDGPLDAIALEETLREICRRHEILRTNFIEIADSVQQVIQPESRWSFPRFDLQHLDGAAQSAEVQQRLRIEEQTPFDLVRDPLMRVSLLQLGPGSHILLLSFHHIVFDGWSGGVFLQEFAALYPAFRAGQPSPLPPLSVQYADYAIWQRQWLTGAQLDRQLQYWQQQFAQLPPPLELPRIHSSLLGEPVRAAGRETFEISPTLTQKLRQLGREVGATLFMTVLAAYAILLSRYSAREDLTIGIPTASRNRTEIEPLIGFFVNTLALRFNLGGNPSFRTLIGQVRRRVLEAQEHQDLPFEKLVEVLQPDRDRSHSPLFRVMFVLQRHTVEEKQVSDLTVKPLASTQATDTFDLTLFLTETEQELGGIWEYDGNRFDKSAIARLTGHLQTLLQGIVAEPDRPVGHLPILTAAEQQQLLSWRTGISPFYLHDASISSPQSAKKYWQSPLIPALFAASVAANPDAIAVQQGEEKLTYRALDERSNQLAHYLRERGVGPETLVGLCVARSLLTIVGLLGILKAGGAYVPIDPGYPDDRIAYIVEDTRVELILSQKALAPKFSRFNADCLLLDELLETLERLPTDSPVSLVESHHLAYIIYTSGSTGKPKGVAIEHRSLASLTQSAIATYNITDRDRVLQFASISFDAAVEEIYPCLCAGATLVLRQGEEIPTSVEFWQQCQDWELTLLDLPTAYWHVLMADLSEESPLPPTLRLLIIGGEQAMPGPWQKWQEWLQAKTSSCSQGRVESINTYGPTETTVVATFYGAPQPQDSSVPSLNNVPIGRPLGGAEVYVLDARAGQVPIGVPGELYIGGVGVARGYLNRPELTANAFINNPFTQDGSRLYKTGDRARYLPDGNLEYLGRADDRVKLRGFRVELGEIEAVLSQHPDIREAAVSVIGTPPQQRLVAHIVPRTSAPSDRQVEDFLRQKLPSYMIPSAWITLEALPRSINGKVERKALPMPTAVGRGERAGRLPQNRLELELAQIWSEVLQVHPIGVQDNFFALGGHSLLGVSLMTKIRQAFGRSLPLATLFQEGTIEQQAVLLRQDNPIQWSPLIPLRATGNQPPLFCLHPGGGSAFVYIQLIQHLNADRPVYGIDARGFEGGQTPHDRVETMAAYYIEALKALQPQGPYHFVGWCFGGLVAFEIARQLHRREQPVAFLCLLDIPDYLNLKEYKFPELPDDEVLQFMELPLFNKKLDYCQQFLPTIPPSERFPYLLEQAKRLDLIPASFGVSEALNLIKVSEAHNQAILNYTFPVHPYPGKVTLIQAQDGITSTFGRSTKGWSQLAKTVEVHWIPGDHFSIIDGTDVKTLAATMSALFGG